MKDVIDEQEVKETRSQNIKYGYIEISQQEPEEEEYCKRQQAGAKIFTFH